jgi:hypothetical protein
MSLSFRKRVSLAEHIANHPIIAGHICILVGFALGCLVCLGLYVAVLDRAVREAEAAERFATERAKAIMRGNQQCVKKWRMTPECTDWN